MKLKARVREITGLNIHSEGAMPPADRVELVEEDGHYFLCRLTQDGCSAGDTWHETLAGAKSQAKAEYGIQDSGWKLDIQIWDHQSIAEGPQLKGTIQDVPDSGARAAESTLEWAVRMFLKHLQTLAADPEILLRAYPPQSCAVDELVNDFAHFLELSHGVVKGGLVSEGYLDKAHMVDQRITDMSERHDLTLWTHDALRTKHEWTDVRRLARQALMGMGYELEPPPPRSM